VSVLTNEMQLLRRTPLLCGVEPAKLKLLAYMSDLVTYHAGEELFHAGDTSDAAYLIVEGNAEVKVDTDAGEITLARLGCGDIAGEIGILCDVPRTATVVAAGEMKALRIRKEPFFELLKQYPEAAIEMLRALAQRLARTSGELVEAQRRIAGGG